MNNSQESPQGGKEDGKIITEEMVIGYLPLLQTRDLIEHVLGRFDSGAMFIGMRFHDTEGVKVSPVIYMTQPVTPHLVATVSGMASMLSQSLIAPLLRGNSGYEGQEGAEVV